MCPCRRHLLENSSPQVEQVVESSCSLVPTITTPSLLPAISLASLCLWLAACLAQPGEANRLELEGQTRQQWRRAPRPSSSWSSVI